MIKKLGALLLMANAALVHAQSLAPGDHRTTITSSYDGSAQPYRLFVPKCAAETTGTLPLVVVLHGHGADQNAWFDYTPVKRVAEEYGYIVASPLARGNWWYRGPAESDVLDIIQEVKKSGQVDPNRVYLAGHSMGGWGTWWIGLRHPDIFAAISPMSGFSPGEMLRSARQLAPFIIHDSLDNIVPVANSRGPAQRLAQLGISFQYREETGYGHSSKLIGDNLPRVFDWFNHHPRVVRPPHIALASRTPHVGDAYWLRLLETENYPKLASIDAIVNTTGELTIQAEGVRKFAINMAELPTSASEPLSILLGKKRFKAPAKRGWAVFTQRLADSWTLALESIAPVPDPPIALESSRAQKLAASAGDPERLAGAVAALLMKATGASACVLDPEKLRLPAAPITGDMILDLSAYPDERLAVFRCPAKALPKAHEAISNKPIKYFSPEVASKGSAFVKVVMPVVIAKQFAEFDQAKDILPEAIGELLFRICSR